MLFQQLELIEPILKALSQEGYTNPTPIQQKSIPVVLSGRDLLACAQTGTGKTAAFTIPLLQMIHASVNDSRERGISALVLTPTRELAIQIEESIRAYGRFLHLKHTVVYGGVSQVNQVKAIRSGVDILVATPGRLLDLLSQGLVNFRHLNFLVLDEADRMLDNGFIHDIKRIITKLPARKQTLLFSATMPLPIRQLADRIMNNPVSVEVTPVSSTVEKIQQSVYHVDKAVKPQLLVNILQDPNIKNILVFTQMKHSADKLCKFLNRSGISSAAIHGNKTQSQRVKSLTSFKNRSTRVLVATDISAIGIYIYYIYKFIKYYIKNFN